MKLRKQCNNCAVNHCAKAKTPLYTLLEQADKLPCFVAPISGFEFADCVSKVKIENPDNPVIQLLSNHSWR